jgi:hypothetical protein
MRIRSDLKVSDDGGLVENNNAIKPSKNVTSFIWNNITSFLGQFMCPQAINSVFHGTLADLPFQISASMTQSSRLTTIIHIGEVFFCSFAALIPPDQGFRLKRHNFPIYC